MSSEIVLKVQDVGKCYEIYAAPHHRLLQTLLRGKKQFYKEFWALKDISFEVKKGECLGIVGRNGSGKSTLLQIITGTLSPTTGSVGINGRVAALLELGSGFNPEFTGRENVYMNGAIMGFSRAQMENKFDEIAAFADIGEFIEQPVKIYSSGMFVRLAFACATVIEPDILIVDEALAVGDGMFIHKCMARIKSLTDKGTVLILVTHDVETVKRFCHKGIWLDSGQIKFIGRAGEAGDRYYAFLRTGNAIAAAKEPTEAISDQKLDFVNFPIVRVSGEINLSDNRLFLESTWAWKSTNGVCGRGRLGQGGQQAVFCFDGTELELCFARGDAWGEPQIAIDGVPMMYTGFCEGAASGNNYISILRFSVINGKHEVRITVLPESRPILWLAGKTKTAAVLSEFRFDPKFINGDPGGGGRHGNGRGRILAAELVDEETGAVINIVQFRQRFQIRVWAENLADIPPLRIGFGVHIKDKNQNWVFGATNWCERLQADSKANRWQLSFGFENCLAGGDYAILLSMAESGENLDTAVHMDVIENAIVFKSVWTPNHPAVQGIVYYPAVVDMVSFTANEKKEI